MSSDKSREAASKSFDPVQRGIKRRSFLGIATFFALRAADPFLQYQILAKGLGTGLIHALGGTPLLDGHTILDSYVGLSPYRSIIFAMSVASMAKQNFHIIAIMQEQIPFSNGLVIGVLNGIFNSLNSLMSITAQTSASVHGEDFPQTALIVGSTMFATGLFFEWFSELQRHLWKKDRANKGKVYDGGLFRLSRHINYFGYTLWRSGYALATGGWVYGAAVGAIFAYDFTQRAIPALQKYLEERVSQHWVSVARRKQADYVHS